MDGFQKIAIDGIKRSLLGRDGRLLDICRYCQTPITTKPIKEAHTIARGLGNVNIITLDECSECNKLFADGIERDALDFWRIHRTIFNINRREKGPAKIKVNDFLLEYNPETGMVTARKGDETFNVKYDEQGFWRLNGRIEHFRPFGLQLITGDVIAPQNVYKYLCKCVLALLGSTELLKFSKTIKWVVDSSVVHDKLPIVFFKENGMVLPSPTLALWIKQRADGPQPFCIGEITFSAFTYAFIVPTFDPCLDKSDSEQKSILESLGNFKDFCDLSSSEQAFNPYYFMQVFC